MPDSIINWSNIGLKLFDQNEEVPSKWFHKLKQIDQVPKTENVMMYLFKLMKPTIDGDFEKVTKKQLCFDCIFSRAQNHMVCACYSFRLV